MWAERYTTRGQVVAAFLGSNSSGLHRKVTVPKSLCAGSHIVVSRAFFFWDIFHAPARWDIDASSSAVPEIYLVSPGGGGFVPVR